MSYNKSHFISQNHMLGRIFFQNKAEEDRKAAFQKAYQSYEDEMEKVKAVQLISKLFKEINDKHGKIFKTIQNILPKIF